MPRDSLQSRSPYLSLTEYRMKIAYIISAHKLPEQLLRLVSRLDTEGAYFFIHVDKKTDEKTYTTMVAGLSGLDNIVFLERHACYWGDFGIVLATLKGINAVLRTGIDFDYVVLLSGQDYPIKSNDYMNEFFKKNCGKEFIDFSPIPADQNQFWECERGGLERIESWHFMLFGRRIYTGRRIFNYSRTLTFLWKLVTRFAPRRKFLPGLKPFGGSCFWCITMDCARYIHDFVKDNKDYVKFFKHVYISDEIFIQTIILNSPFRENVVNDSLRCIDWSHPGPTGPTPWVWRKEDIDVLGQSTGLFARKFDSDVDSEILDLIDARLLLAPCTSSR